MPDARRMLERSSEAGARGLHMASETTVAAIQRELKARAVGGTPFNELIEYADQQRARLNGRLTDEEYHALSIYCWALTGRQSRRIAFGENGAWLPRTRGRAVESADSTYGARPGRP